MSVLRLCKVATVAVCLTAGSAYASTVNFLVGAGSGTTSTSSCTNCTLTITPNASLVGTAFSLGAGETERVALFDVLLSDAGLISGGEFEVDTTLAFDIPGGSISSSGDADFISFFGFISLGTLDWTQSAFNVAFGNGGLYSVALEEGIGLVLGKSKTIYADVTLEVSPVPLPAPFLLLLGGIGGLGVMRMRRKRSSASPA